MEEIKKEGFFTRLGKGLKYRVRKTLIAIYHNPYTANELLSSGYYYHKKVHKPEK